MDHSAAIMKGIDNVFGDVKPTIISCYFHLMQSVKKKIPKPDAYQLVFTHLSLLRDTKNDVLFNIAVGLIISIWKGDSRFKSIETWFQNTYLTPPWSLWRYNVGKDGIGNTNNSMESVNATIKRQFGNNISLGNFLHSTMKSILEYYKDIITEGEYLINKSTNLLTFITQHQLPIELKANFQLILMNDNTQDNINIKNVDNNTYYVNNSYCINNKYIGNKIITNFRIQHYQSTIINHAIINEMQYINTENEPEVNLNDDAADDHLSIRTFKLQYMTLVKIVKIEDKYICECPYFHNSKFICEHILCLLSIFDKIDVLATDKPLAMNNKRGRKRKSVNISYLKSKK